MGVRSNEGVLITGVYGAGKSTVAAEICYLLEQRRQLYALLDVDFLSWGIAGYGDDASGNPFMANDRPVPVVAEQIMSWLGWL